MTTIERPMESQSEPVLEAVRSQLASTWMPAHSGREPVAGCVWLPRMIEKGRRILEGEASGQDLLGEYLFGVNDPADAQLLRFLGATNEDVLDVLRQQPDDTLAAEELVRRSGRTPEECAAWSARYLRRNGPFLAMMDADEGRRAAGKKTAALRFLYNRVVMPPSYVFYRRQERKRLASASGTTETTSAEATNSEATNAEATRGGLAGRVPLVPALLLGLGLSGAIGWVAWRRLSRD